MGAAYDQLKEAHLTPTDAEAQTIAATELVKKEETSKWVGGANFRLRNDVTGVRIGLDLATALKAWRGGYSGNSVFEDVYSDPRFVSDLATVVDAE